MRSCFRLAGLALASAFLIGFSPAARAGDFLIDPTGGTDLRSLLSDLDDGYAPRSLGFSFDFFDVTRNAINVTTNGFIHVRKTNPNETTPNVSPANAALPTSGTIHRIAGAWDDLILSRAEDSIIETKGTNYYAATYFVHKNIAGGGETQFQIALFGGNVTVGGYDFKKNDIVFSYKKMIGIPVGGTATVGLDAGNGSSFSTPSDFPNGLVDDYSKIVLFSANGSGLGSQGLGPETGFYKFSPNPTGGYDATIVATGGGTPGAAPEPGTLAFLGLGVSVMGGIALRRRRS